MLEDALSGEGDNIIPSEDEAISVADKNILNYDVSDELIATIIPITS